MATFLTPELIQQAKRLIESAAQLEGFVPGEGSLTPRFTIVSEAPGRVEAETGHGFMGPAGQELNTWLAELDVTRDEIYMTGAVRARPFATLKGRKRDRKPTRAEENAFAPLLDAELAALPAANDLLVPLGNTGLQRLIGLVKPSGTAMASCFRAQFGIGKGTIMSGRSVNTDYSRCFTRPTPVDFLVNEHYLRRI